MDISKTIQIEKLPVDEKVTQIDADGGIIAGHGRVTRAELARIANVNRSSVSRWVQKGNITIGSDGKIGLQDIPRDFFFARKKPTIASKILYAKKKITIALTVKPIKRNYLPGKKPAVKKNQINTIWLQKRI